MKKIAALLLLVCLSLNGFACKKKRIKNIVNMNTPIELTEDQEKISASANEFSLKFLSTIILLEKNNSNVFVSPFSASTAFSMVSAGAVGETQKQILNALCYGNYTQEQINGFYKVVVPGLVSADPATKLSVANSIWTIDGFKLKTQYVKLLGRDYDAESRIMYPEKAVNDINNWCSQKTNGLVKNMVDNVSNLKVMLINALYFKGTWTDKFNVSKSYDDKFHNSDSSESNVKFMFRSYQGGIWIDDNFSAVSLPYGNRSYIMTVILPKEGRSVNDILAELTPQKFGNIANGNKRGNIQLSLPRFNQEYCTEDKLVTAMKSMGMEIPFTNSADFSAMCGKGLCIDNAKQKAVIKVNEEGTEAAAVTTIGMRLTSAGPEPMRFIFKADRPFIYFISEVDTGLILFTGVKNSFKE